jgi:hypothetical protein
MDNPASRATTASARIHLRKSAISFSLLISEFELMEVLFFNLSLKLAIPYWLSVPGLA